MCKIKPQKERQTERKKENTPEQTDTKSTKTAPVFLKASSDDTGLRDAIVSSLKCYITYVFAVGK